MTKTTLDAEITIPESGPALSPEAEHDIQSAENLLSAGVPPLLVLRTLYMLARFSALNDMAKL